MSGKDILINNTLLVKKTNVELVRAYLRKNRTATRAEIAKETGLSIATSGNILNEMLKAEEVFEDEMEESSGGRPARRYGYNENYIQVACIAMMYDSQIKTLKYIIANSFGEIVEESVKAYDMLTPDAVDDVVSKIIKKYPGVQALTISIPGESYEGIIRFCDIKEMQDAPLEIDLSNKYGIKVNVEGWPHVTAYGYYQANPELEGKTMAVLIAPQNLYMGAGIVVNGQLIRGDKHLAGEVSFISSNLTREKALEEMARDNDFFMNSLTTATTAIISVINPTRIVIAGGVFEEGMRESLYKKCREVVPEVFMPELEIISDTEDFFTIGIIHMALNHSSIGLQLISKDV